MLYNFANAKKSTKNKKEKVKNNPILPPTPPTPTMENPGTYLRDNGVLCLAESFKQESVMPLIYSIMEYNLMPDEVAPERITLMINSPGGRIDSCLALIDSMKMSSIPVDTYCTGLAASCGILTLMAGDRRYASSTSQIMSHQYASGSGGKEHELYGRMKSFEQTSRWMENHYMECTGNTVKKIRKHLLGPTDVWLSAEEALEWNIIDDIIDPYAVNRSLRQSDVAQ